MQTNTETERETDKETNKVTKTDNKREKLIEYRNRKIESCYNKQMHKARQFYRANKQQER